MLSYSLLSINKNLNIPEVFSGILTNGPKQKLAKIKLNTLHEDWQFGTSFSKMGISGPKQIKRKLSLNSKYSFKSKLVNFEFLDQFQSNKIFPL